MGASDAVDVERCRGDGAWHLSWVRLAVFVTSIIALSALAQIDRRDASRRRSSPLSGATA